MQSQKKVTVGKTLKLSSSSKKKSESGSSKKAEIESALATVAPQQARPAAKITPQEGARRTLLAKAYSRHMMALERKNMQKLCEAAGARNDALLQLQLLSPLLYDKALVVDKNMYPLQLKPATDTPPLE